MKIKGIEIDTRKLNTEFRRKKAERCANYLLQIIQSDKFKNLILNMDREKWLKGESKGSPFLKMSNEEIYKYLMEANEEWNNKKDYVLQLIIDDFKGRLWSKVVGYMNPGKPTIHINTRFFDTTEDIKVVANLGHEGVGHTMGARHSGPFFRESFAYFINYAVELCADIVALEPIKTKKVCKRIWYMPWRYRCNVRVLR
jgi:coproporphyrinogen III oxidase